MKAETEVCRSPIRPDCGRRDVALYIFFGGELLPVCWRCWREIVDVDLTWQMDASEEELRMQVERARARIRETGLSRGRA
ncbi:MAG: hypothetical protein QXX29_04065 [Nitrososphaerota archaeon]